MFQYGSDGTCKFLPHLSLKDKNIYDVITRDTSGVNSIYVLQCSPAFENVLKNNHPYTQSYEGPIKVTLLV